jgi:hypothetical protein
MSPQQPTGRPVATVGDAQVTEPAPDRGPAGPFFKPGAQGGDMKSTRKGLRDGELVKDTYERLTCAECEKVLKKKDDPDEVFAVRTCPECGREWKDLR